MIVVWMGRKQHNWSGMQKIMHPTLASIGVKQVVPVKEKSGPHRSTARECGKNDRCAILTMSHRHSRQDTNLSHRMLWATQQTYLLVITGISIPNLEDILSTLSAEIQKSFSGKDGL